MYEIMPTRRSSLLGNPSFRSINPFSILDEMEKGMLSDTASLGFKTDIKDNGDSYELDADLPGFAKDDIHVEVDGDTLTISAERQSESEEKDDSGNYIRRERSYGSFARAFDISNINADGIKVTYTDGVLKLDMPKKGEDEPKTKRLEIS